MAKVRIDVDGLKQLQAACKDSKEAVKDLKRVHKALAEKVITWAKPDMPEVTGEFKRGWKGSQIKSGVKAVNKVGYAKMLEEGGASFWKPKDGRFARVPMGDGFRTMKRHSVWKKPPAPQGSYYIIPAFLKHVDEFQEMYAAEVKRIFDSHW